MTGLSRRSLLVGAGAVVLVGCRDGGGDAATTSTTTSTTTTTQPPVGPYPFPLGVASGDPDHGSVVLWTTVDRDGDVGVEVEVSVDEGFETIVASGVWPTDESVDHTVHAIVDGLDADTAYWYRFRVDGHVTPPARTRTAPAPGSEPDRLVVAHLSCQRWSDGYWTALDDVAAEAPDVVVHCGDYVYESDGGDVRPVDEPPPTDVAGYRRLWRRYQSDPSLQAAHAVAPWLVVWDDHEVENNYQGRDPSRGSDTDAFLARRAAAYRAWWEHTPTRLAAPDGPDLAIHRRVDWGRLVSFVLLDTRQHRDDQPCAEEQGPRCPETETVTMLGAAQEEWLAGALDHGAAWTVVVQQVVVHQWRALPGNRLWNLDQWDGYTGARRRLLDALADAADPVVLTGDVHSSWVSDLRVDFDDPDSEAVGVEFVGPGVSSRAPDRLQAAADFVTLQSPHIQWQEVGHRGWVRHVVTPDEWTAEYRHVVDADVEGSAVEVASTWRAARGERRVRPAD